MGIELSVAIASYPYTKYLKDGTVGIDGVELRFVEIEGPITAAFRRMARTQEFDISEFGITTCFSSIEKGLPVTAIPVFLTRQLDHNTIFYNANSTIREPRDIEGMRVGIRPYTIAGGVWARAILSEIYGVDLDRTNWVVVDEEHVLDCAKPPNVEYLPGANLAEMLESGEIDAGIGIYRGRAEQVRPMFTDLAAAAGEWMSKVGSLPIHHTVVLRNDIFNKSPELARAVYEAFVRANLLCQQEDTNETVEQAQPDSLAHAPAEVPTNRYGITPNQSVLEMLVRIADEQHFSPRPLRVEELFYPGSIAW